MLLDSFLEGGLALYERLINLSNVNLILNHIMLTKLEKKEYRKLGKLILSLPTDSKQFHEITPRFLELNQKRYNPFYNRGAK